MNEGDLSVVKWQVDYETSTVGLSDKAKALVASVSYLGSAFHETAPERMELEQWRP